MEIVGIAEEIIEAAGAMEVDTVQAEEKGEGNHQVQEQEIDYWSRIFPQEHRGRILKITLEPLEK